MSYILDALRKSEQERRRTGAPDLTTEHRPASARGGRQRFLTGVLVLALIGNAAVLGVWLLRGGDDRREPPTVTQSADSSAPPEEAPGNEGASSAGTSAPPMPDDGTGTGTGTVEPVPGTDSGAGTERSAAEPGAEPVSIHALPERIRSRIPPLSFSTHIYAEEADWREVGINGRVHGEGARIQGMRLERITETGVILELDGWRFRVSVLENWDY
jgi:general secretion pathway protein B